jgi:hypothetical protein
VRPEDQFLKVEIKLADRILEQFKEEAVFVVQIKKDNLDKILHLLNLNYVEESCNSRYVILPGEGIWPYYGGLEPTYYACSEFDPIPLIIGLEKIRSFLAEWDPDNE